MGSESVLPQKKAIPLKSGSAHLRFQKRFERECSVPAMEEAGTMLNASKKF